MRLPWRRQARREADQQVDEWARQGLEVAVPEGSFERVWAGVPGHFAAAESPGATPWELLLAVRRLRMWTRALGGGLAVVTAVLATVLVRGGGPHGSEESGRQLLAAAMPAHNLLTFPATERAAHRRYDLLADSRIVLGKVSR